MLSDLFTCCGKIKIKLLSSNHTSVCLFASLIFIPLLHAAPLNTPNIRRYQGEIFVSTNEGATSKPNCLPLYLRSDDQWQTNI